MDLLEKFATVQIQSDNRISKFDKEYCETQQKAYEAAIDSFKELATFWASVKKSQQELVGDSESPTYHNYIASREGPSISDISIEKHIESLHFSFIEVVVHYFNRTYNVTVQSYEISNVLLPQKPRDRWSCNMEEAEQYHRQMQNIVVHYQDIVDQIILQLDGRSFSEQAFFELFTQCHNAAWNTSQQAARFERKKDTIRFIGYFCRFRGWPYDGWELEEKMKDILRGVAHFETGVHGILPCGFSNLLGYQDIKEDVVEFSTCGKVKQMKMFKNNRVDLKFRSADFAEEFITTYLGTVC